MLNLFKIKSLTLLAYSVSKYLQHSEMTNLVPDTKKNKWLSVINNQLTVHNSRQCGEAKASTSDINVDNDRTHLFPSGKHAGHKLVVKAYNGPGLAHQQN